MLGFASCSANNAVSAIHSCQLHHCFFALAFTRKPTDVLEWRTVTQEMENFLAADSLPAADSEGGGGRHASPPLPIRCQLESPLAGVPFTVGL